MKNRTSARKVSLLTFIAFSFLIVSGCERKYPDEVTIQKAKDKTQFILDSLQTNQNVIVENTEILEEFFDENAGQYIINYNIKTGLDSASIIDTEASMFIVPDKNNRWRYNFVFDESYTGIIQ